MIAPHLVGEMNGDYCWPYRMLIRSSPHLPERAGDQGRCGAAIRRASRRDDVHGHGHVEYHRDGESTTVATAVRRRAQDVIFIVKHLCALQLSW